MKRIINIIGVVCALICASTEGASATDFCNHGPAKKFVELDLHLMVGGTAITQNYMGCFHEIRELNTTMSLGAGFGATADLALRDYLAIGTQVNVIVANNRFDIAVRDDDDKSISNIFLRNRAYYLNFPVYASFRFNLAKGLRWKVNTGLYYSYGFAGSQKQTVYNTMVNDLGSLISRVVTTKPSFFNNNQTFINRFVRGDIGLHVATALNFGQHYQLGVLMNVGLKNISQTAGLKNPNIHNVMLMATAGYRF